jgi:SAM-dependent methyltransferase
MMIVVGGTAGATHPSESHGRKRPAGPRERLPSDPRDPLWGDHVSRYRFASKLVREGGILDAGSGSGFGAALLSDAAGRDVVAIDIAAEAIAASRRYASLQVVRGDLAFLPFRRATFSLVTCLEAIEHVPDFDAVVRELRRVVRDDGVVVLSTPNGEVTGQAGHRPSNPFHIQEFEPSELGRALNQHFRGVELLGQRLSSAYRIAPQIPRRQGPSSLLRQVQWFTWRVQNKLPFFVREAMAKIVSGSSFYPGESSFSFRADQIDESHVIVAVCRP